MPTPQLKRPATYGVFLRWPLDGTDWIHPEDVDRVRDVVPSARVLRRELRVDEYVVLSYGKLRIRVRPTLWQIVRTDGFDLGDMVEIRSRMGKNWPCLVAA